MNDASASPRGSQPTLPWSGPVLRWLAVIAMASSVIWVAGRLSVPERRLPTGNPGDLGLDFDALRLTTSDGLGLAAWAVEPSPAGPRARGVSAVVLIFHGKDGCRSPARLALVSQAGFAGLAIDHRAHGESDGLRTGFGWFERLDVAAAVGAARQRWGDVPLLGWGTSQGAAALIYAIDPEDGVLAPDTFAGLLLESLYTDIDTAFEQRVGLSLGRWAVPWAGPLKTLAAWRAGLSGLELSPLKSLQRLAATGLDPNSVLLAGGAEDQHATPAELQQLVDALPGCEVELLPGLGHVDLLSRGPRSWRERVVGFVTRCASVEEP